MADTRSKSAAQLVVGCRRERKRKQAHPSELEAGSRFKEKAGMHTEVHHRNADSAASLQPPAKRQRQCAGASACWGALCPDVRGLILSKLSLQQHASATPVCREFLEEFIPRVAKERAARISLAEGRIGKAVFSAFVTAVQRLLCGLPPYPHCPPSKKSGAHFVFNAAGGIEPMTDRENTLEMQQKIENEGGAHIWKFRSALNGILSLNNPRSQGRTEIHLSFSDAHNKSTSEPQDKTFTAYADFASEAGVVEKGGHAGHLHVHP